MKDINKQHFQDMLERYRQNTANKAEVEFLERYYEAFEEGADLINDHNESSYAFVRNEIKSTADKRIAALQSKGRVKRLWLGGVAAAVAVAIAVSVSAYFFADKSSEDLIAQVDELALPGGNKATLTLANGAQVVLTEAANGEIARQAGISITKTADGKIIYTVAKAGADAEMDEATAQLKNTITTPNGGEYTVVLPDGTMVKLNAASSLVFPTAFQGDERMVELSGEAYFEVAKNRQMPFRIKSGMQTVEVLGTHFNISAYDNEETMKTTLAEGSVKVSSGSYESIIVPGQQTLVNRQVAGPVKKQAVNLDKELAWTNNQFVFEDDDIRSVMRKISRWYNIDIRYEGDLSDNTFSGGIFRSMRLSEVLKILKLQGFDFDVRGREITIRYKAEDNNDNN
ncbi:FecR family protein [Pedobacter deserti]|uniref:FecR family protein n=1 Tax=Pedobacter deserti TaxID=2817382 RepID=UPI00210A2745|nr:FecR domain-containing protein [Pedobacter sp. SYSU D00382]